MINESTHILFIGFEILSNHLQEVKKFYDV